MVFDLHANLATSVVLVAPSPPTSGTTLTVAVGEGPRLGTPPFNATVAPFNTYPTPANAEIVRVTGITGDVVTIQRAQEGTTARAISVGDRIFQSITAKTLTDIEAMQRSFDIRSLDNFSSVANAPAYTATDALSAFRAAEAWVLGGLRRGIYVPPGLYKLSATPFEALNGQSDIAILSEGWETTTLQMMATATAGKFFKIGDNADSARRSGIYIGSFTLQLLNNTPTAEHAITVQNAAVGRIGDMNVVNVAGLIEVGNGSGSAQTPVRFGLGRVIGSWNAARGIDFIRAWRGAAWMIEEQQIGLTSDAVGLGTAMTRLAPLDTAVSDDQDNPNSGDGLLDTWQFDRWACQGAYGSGVGVDYGLIVDTGANNSPNAVANVTFDESTFDHIWGQAALVIRTGAGGLAFLRNLRFWGQRLSANGNAQIIVIDHQGQGVIHGLQLDGHLSHRLCGRPICLSSRWGSQRLAAILSGTMQDLNISGDSSYRPAVISSGVGGWTSRFEHRTSQAYGAASTMQHMVESNPNAVVKVEVDAAGGTFKLTGFLARPTITVHSRSAGGTVPVGTYYYVITAYNGDGETDYTLVASHATVSGSQKINLTWVPVPNATGYRIYRSSSATGPFNRLTQIANPATLTYTDDGAASEDGTTHPPGTNGTGVPTGDLAYNITAAALKTAVEALNPLGASTTRVVGGPGGLSGPGGAAAYLVEFTGTLSGIDVPTFTADATSLTGDGTPLGGRRQVRLLKILRPPLLGRESNFDASGDADITGTYRSYVTS